jgi:hypothetical protein
MGTTQRSAMRRGVLSRRTRAMMERLESRELFSLLNVMPGLPAVNVVGPDGSLTYTAATHSFVATAVPVAFILNSSTIVPVGTPSGFTLNVTVHPDSTGALPTPGSVSSGTATSDLSLSGSVSITTGSVTTTYSGTLLTGTVTQMGADTPAGTNSNFDFRFTVTGGSLAPAYFAGQDIGFSLTAENSTFTGSFNSDFTALTKGIFGAIPPLVTAQPISLSGFKYVDQSGNGLSADDYSHPMAGVTIQLLNSSSQVIATTVTGSNGAYVFNNGNVAGGLSAGKYTIKEVTPSGWLETGPASGSYSVTAVSGGTYTGLNFDNFQTQNCQVNCISYVINGCKTVSDISGQLHQGDTVKVTFTLPAPETISFVSYTAPDNYFVASHAAQQQIYDVDTGIFAKAGTYCLTVTVPNCYYQVDLVCGLPIDHFGAAGSNNFYSAQQRLHDSDNGGTTPCNYTLPSTGSLAGTVYNDSNNDGKQESGEAGIAGVTVTLTGTGGTFTTTTDKNGNYKFSALPSGNYTVSESQPAGFVDGMDAVGNLGGVLGNDVISNIYIGASENGTGYNFGEIKNVAAVCNNNTSNWNNGFSGW